MQGRVDSGAHTVLLLTGANIPPNVFRRAICNNR
jgi:hypothetical protein